MLILSYKYRTFIFLLLAGMIAIQSCSNNENKNEALSHSAEDSILVIDTNLIPNDKFGEQVRYGRNLLLHTSYYIGPDGVNGKYLGNKMNCTNCHQDAGTKPFSLNLITSHTHYPQYRPREGKVLSLAERVNNCVMRPHNGRPLPLDSREMISILSYLKWINGFAPKDNKFLGAKNISIQLPTEAASSDRGKLLFQTHCVSCHGAEGQGVMQIDGITYQYPPLWGPGGYQPGSSMHRNIKMAQWLKSNMPHNLAKWDKPVLSDKEALDIAAFINDDKIHPRPNPKNLDYPNIEEKPIDYPYGPFIDTFSEASHKYGPFQPIIDYWNAKGMKAVW